MSMVPNPTLKRLREGKLALGFCVYHLRSSASAMLAHATGYDWLFIDTEHGAFSIQEASRQSGATCASTVSAGPGRCRPSWSVAKSWTISAAGDAPPSRSSPRSA